MTAARKISDVSSVPKRKMDEARLEIARLVPGPDLSLVEIYRKTCEITARTIDVARVSIWLLSADGRAIRCTDMFDRLKNEHTDGTILRVSDSPNYFHALSTRKTIPAEQAQTDPRTCELTDSYLRPLGITSLLDAPIIVGDHFIGLICSEHIGEPREWSTEDKDFIGSVADMIAIKNRNSELRDAQLLIREHEARLASLEKSEALGKMATGVAHDFNNLLMGIMGNTDLLGTLEGLPKESGEYLHNIIQICRRGQSLANELMMFGNDKNNYLQVFSAIDAVKELLPSLQAMVGPKYNIDVQISQTRARVFINLHEFTRVIQNLIMNARDSMPKGGTIRLRISKVSHNETFDSTTVRYILIEIQDQGMGMSSETKMRLFEPYFSTKDSGHGLGMTIVKKFVEQAGGQIDVYSQVGKGTTIRLLYPKFSESPEDETLF